MSFSFGDVIYMPTGSSLGTATSALGKMMCANPGPNPTGVQNNDYTLRNPVDYLIPRLSGHFHPTYLNIIISG